MCVLLCVFYCVCVIVCVCVCLIVCVCVCIVCVCLSIPVCNVLRCADAYVCVSKFVNLCSTLKPVLSARETFPRPCLCTCAQPTSLCFLPVRLYLARVFVPVLNPQACAFCQCNFSSPVSMYLCWRVLLREASPCRGVRSVHQASIMLDQCLQPVSLVLDQCSLPVSC